MEDQKIAPRGREISFAARMAEQGARYLCGAILPGIFLGALLPAVLEKLRDGGGFFAISGVPLVVMALEAIFGAVLAGSWRERYGQRGFLLLPALLLFLLGIFPEPRFALAVGGAMLGGYLTSLPIRDGGYRLLFGAAFALTALLLPEGERAMIPVILLFPLLFGATILWVNAHWVIRLAMILMLPVSTLLFTNREFRASPPAPPPAPRTVATALPAVLLPNADATRILFLSEQMSYLPETWGTMPFVSSVESIQPEREHYPRDRWSKLRQYSGSPGSVVASLTGTYHLIYLESLPGGSEAARRGFIERLWRLLDPDSGVLILPSGSRLLLPDTAQWALLPGADGAFVAASRQAVPVDLELLDRRLQSLLAPYGEESYIPAGLLPALYFTATPPELPEVENQPITGFATVPSNFWLGLGCLLGSYLVIRLYFRRFGKNTWGFGLAENGAAFALILLAAYDAMLSRELFTGLGAAMLWGCVGIACFAPRLRPRAGKWLALAAALLPGIWLLPWSLFTMEPGWLAVVAIAALATGATRCKLVEEANFPRSWSTTFSAAGWVFGAAAYAVLTVLLPDPLLPALIVAAALKLVWPLEF